MSGAIKGGFVSLDDIGMLIGHMAQQSREHETLALGADIKEASDRKSDLRDAIKKMKDEIRDQQALMAEQIKDDEGFQLDDINPFSSDDAEDTQQAIQKSGIELEKKQVSVTESQEKLETLRSDAKDVNEQYDTSRKIYESVQQELEATRATAIQY